MKKKTARVKGPASRMSVRANTKLKGVKVGAIRTREEHLVHGQKEAMKTITNAQMMADTFNVIHTRICMNDGISNNGDVTETREKLFEIISVRGWESTLKILASCARLFAEVPTPVPKLTDYANGLMHRAAQTLDAQAMELRHVDKEATKGHQI